MQSIIYIMWDIFSWLDVCDITHIRWFYTRTIACAHFGPPFPGSTSSLTCPIVPYILDAQNTENGVFSNISLGWERHVVIQHIIAPMLRMALNQTDQIVTPLASQEDVNHK